MEPKVADKSIFFSPKQRIFDLLKLPGATGPAERFLTEFEDDWPYRIAPADVYFSRDANQAEVRRPPIIHVVSAWPRDPMLYAIAVLLVVPPLVRRIARQPR